MGIAERIVLGLSVAMSLGLAALFLFGAWAISQDQRNHEDDDA